MLTVMPNQTVLIATLLTTSVSSVFVRFCANVYVLICLSVPLRSFIQRAVHTDNTIYDIYYIIVGSDTYGHTHLLFAFSFLHN